MRILSRLHCGNKRYKNVLQCNVKCNIFHMCLHFICYLAYTEFEAVLGQTSRTITVEFDVVVTSSFPFLFIFATNSPWSCGFLEAGSDSGGAGGEPQAGEAGETGDAGVAGDACETGDGGDVGDVGDGGDRRGDGGVWLACASLSMVSWHSGIADSTGGSGFFSAVLVSSSSSVGTCFCGSMLISCWHLRSWL